MKCHQRVIRDDHMAKDGCALGRYKLKDCVVRPISRKEAVEIIMRYEWLQSMPQVGMYYYGLIRPDGEIIGAACFGAGPSKHARDFCGEENIDRVLCLERGACAPIKVSGQHADGAASRLISRACRDLVHRTRKDPRGIGAFFAYSDVAAGEIGTVYQASNWIYIGQGVGRATKDKNGNKIHKRTDYGRFDYFHPSGERYTSRRMRALLKKRKEIWPGMIPESWTLKQYYPMLEYHGWTRERQREKHKYLLILDPTLKLDTKRFQPCKYPKRTDGSVGASLVDWRTYRWPCYQEK